MISTASTAQLTAVEPNARLTIVGDERPNVVISASDPLVWARIADVLAPTGLALARGVAHGLEAPQPGDLLIVYRDAMSSPDLAMVRQLRLEHQDVQIVVVCRVANARSARRAIDAGVNGLVFASQIETALAATVAAVVAGQTAVPGELVSSLRKPSLSFREKQILGLVALGLTNSQIGARLFLAESTIKSHLSASFAKLGVASRSEAAALILDPHDPLGPTIMKIAEDVERTAGAAARA